MPIEPLDPASYGGGATIDITNWVAQDLPNGVVDNVNTIFTLNNTPVANSEQIFKNGQRLIRGMDYTMLGTQITLTTAPKGTDAIHASYYKV